MEKTTNLRRSERLRIKKEREAAAPAGKRSPVLITKRTILRRRRGRPPGRRQVTARRKRGRPPGRRLIHHEELPRPAPRPNNALQRAWRFLGSTSMLMIRLCYGLTFLF